MAPMSRGSRARGGFAFRRGRGGRTTQRAPSKRFLASRIESTGSSDSGEEGSGDDNTISARDDAHSLSSGSSESSEDEEPAVAGHAFTSLLQDLISERQTTEPPAKRRKIANGLVSIDANPLELPPADKEEPDAANDSREDDDDDIASVISHVDSDDEKSDSSDPYVRHFAPSPNELRQSIEKVKSKQYKKRDIANGDKSKVVHIGVQAAAPALLSLDRPIDEFKQRIRERASSSLDQLHAFMQPMARGLLGYMDILHHDRHIAHSAQQRGLLAMHSVNHVLKIRDRVLKNSHRIAQANGEQDFECRDQGFTRPKVLFLLPTRQACARQVDEILAISGAEQIEHQKRFNDTFSSPPDLKDSEKPYDFKDLFKGNDDDMFRVGIKYTRKSIKLFSNFYNSDMILASPLGLRTSLEGKGSKSLDRDFLSSIEIVVVDQADALLMQNWDHVEYIFDCLNQLPSDAHGCDFSRVREWYLDGQAQYLRQTVVLSAFATPEVQRLANQHMLNIAGRLTLAQRQYAGLVDRLGSNIPQTLTRFEVPQPADDPDLRFKLFTSTILPMLRQAALAGTKTSLGILLFISSYLDFVRVRNFLASSIDAQDISFGSISEYSSGPEASRARSHFQSGRHAVLLYTGRAHHFRRYRLRGVKKVILYALPDNPLFYQEIVGDFLARSIGDGLVSADQASARALFSRWDALKLERIVGSHRLSTLIHSPGDVFDFV